MSEVSSLRNPEAPRHSALVRVTHWIAVIAFFALLLSGAEIVVSHPRFYWGEIGNVRTTPIFTIPIPSSRETVPTGYDRVLPDQNGWSRYLHFEAAWAVVLTGLVYVAASLWNDHFRRHLVPEPAQRTWRAYWDVVAKYLRRAPRQNADAQSYNVFQRTAYLSVIFILFPLVIWTGLALSPSFDSALPMAVSLLGGRQSARTLHCFVSGLLVLFLIIHVTMVILAGFCSRTRPMITGHADTHREQPIVSAEQTRISHISRRTLITTGIAATASVTGLTAAARLTRHYGLIPPDSGALFGPGETVTYAAQRILTTHSLAREFPRSMISKNPFANETPPLKDDFKRHQASGFSDWRLAVDGMVSQPASLSLSDLKSFPVQSQITEVACEEGWSYIAEWIGTPLVNVLHTTGLLPQARYVVYYSIDRDSWESIDMDEALHPQTLLTYGMNDGDLPAGFGGPLRLRVPRQLGYKSVKYITRLTATDNLKRFGKGLGSASPEHGYAWYAGI